MKLVSIAMWGVAGVLAVSTTSALDPPKPAPSQAASQPANSSEPRVLEWEDLIPEQERNRLDISSGEAQSLFDDESGPAAVQQGSSAVNAALDGKQVRLPGFVVPLNIDKNLLVTDFLLVPYFGACIHVPPPPPNQIVYVVMDKPFRLATMYDPVWVTGRLSTKSATTGLADAAYSLAARKIERYEEPP